jgi:hypothetical protein
MKQLDSLDKFAKQLEMMVSAYDRKLDLSLNFVGKELVKAAKDKIGHLNDAAGEFPAWKELAESTKRDKERNDYVFNADYNPLYREGELRKSINYRLNKTLRNKTLKLGSTSKIMIYQEKGTDRIPPRPVIGPTMFQSIPILNYSAKAFYNSWLTNKLLKIRENTYIPKK